MTPITELNHKSRKQQPLFMIVHPLDDVPETKINTEHLGQMRMTKTVQGCLLALRCYLLLMFGLLVFRVLELAGVLRG